jgi:hypothetical protein
VSIIWGKMKIFLITIILVAGFCLAAQTVEPLRIVRPRVFQLKSEELEVPVYKTEKLANGTFQSVPTKNKQKLVRYKFKAVFFLYNSSEKTIKVATGFTSKSLGPQKTQGPMVFWLSHCILKYNPGPRGIKFDIINKPEELGVVEIRPGEGTFISVEFAVSDKIFANSNGKFIIHYNPDNLKRYDFLTCSIKSKPVVPRKMRLK